MNDKFVLGMLGAAIVAFLLSPAAMIAVANIYMILVGLMVVGFAAMVVKGLALDLWEWMQ